MYLIWLQVGSSTTGDDYLDITTLSDNSQTLNAESFNLENINNYLNWCQDRKYKFWVTQADNAGLSSEVDSLIDTFRNQTAELGIVSDTFATFSSESDLESYARDKDYASNPYICGAVVLQSGGPQWRYSIRMNASLSFSEDYPQQTPDTRDKTSELQLEGEYPSLLYAGNGFLAVQNFVDAWIIDSSVTGLGYTFFPVTHQIQPMPLPEYTDDTFATIVGVTLGLFLVLTFTWPLQRIIKSLVEEKQYRIKDLMFQMSLSPTAWYMAWLSCYATMFLLTSILIVIITAGNIYKNSSAFLIFLLFFFFSMDVFAFGYMMSSLFSKANTAATLSTVIWLGSFFGYYGINDDTSTSARTFACISAPVCMGQAAFNVATLESSGLGWTQETSDTEINMITLNAMIGMLIFDFFLYTFVGLYLERVWPGEYGVPLSPWFIFDPNYWCPGSFKSTRNNKPRVFPKVYDPNPEKPLPAGIERGLEVTNLRKEFGSADGSFVAVDDLNVDMFRDQVFALLGHNGAGKTTTINMLTGMYTVTSGDAVLHPRGESSIRLSSNLSGLQRKLGVCPQHDVLYPDLTVREHLKMMARIKGLSGNEISEEVEKFVQLVGLTEKIDVKTQALSGGQKRKLSISMALIGHSDLVFLDEPTSGVDPYSRRSMWEAIRRAKKDRVIILTTHFMDEADTLGDRIGIMEHGKLACCGSSLHLKKWYGVGYTLTISVGAGGDVKSVRGLVHKYIPTVQTRTTAGEIQCRLPLKSSKAFPALMKQLDEDSKKYNILNYGISVTTLEEVFLKVGAATKEVLDEDEIDLKERRDSDEAKDDTTVESNSMLGKEGRISAVRMEPIGDQKDGKNLLSKKTDKKKAMGAEEIQMLNDVDMHESSMMRQMYALLLKRYWNYKRDKRGWAWTLIYPLCILLLGIGLMQLGIEGDFPSLTLDGTMFNSPNFIPVNDVGWNFLNSQFDSSSAHFINASTQTCEDQLSNTNFPIEFSNISAPNAASSMQDYLSCTWANLYKESRYISIVGWDTEFNFEGQDYGGVVDQYKENSGDSGSIRQTTWGDPMNEKASQRRTPFHGFYNTTGYHAPAVLLNMMNKAMARNYTQNTDFDIITTNNPLPLTDNEKRLPAVILGLLISLSFAIIPAFYIYFIVNERASGAKHQQIISGVNLYAYWMTTWIWDCVSTLLPGFLAMFIFLGFGIEELIGENSGAMILNILLYGLVIPAFTYANSFMFTNANFAQNIMLLNYVSAGPMLAIASQFLDQISSTADINKHLKFVYRLHPSFCFSEVVINLIRRDRNGNSAGIWEMDTVGWPMVFMFWELIVYFLLTIGIEFAILNPQFFDWLGCCAPTGELQDQQATLEEGDEDEDVIAEKKRIQQMAQSEKKDMVTLHGLRKVFGGVTDQVKVAVRDMHFGVPMGQCFGFLGINGAGKTTTLKMLTGAIYPSRGEAYLNGYSATKEQAQIRKYLGYCPQFDAFIGTLTARETLTMFGHIKGIPQSDLDVYVDGVINILGLSEYADRPAEGYSGGNKRKLSVGIALMGNPPMVFLDEPSTGMDPASRRTMWNLIRKTMSKRAVILTTHSMEECVALCQRIGIMVGGRFRCLGTEQHLRSRFGNAYQIDARLEDQRDTKLNEDCGRVLKEWMKKEFKGAQVVEDQLLTVKFRVPKSESLTLGSAFARIEGALADLKITEYSLSEMSLEQIFIYFARQQREERQSVAGFDFAETKEAKEVKG
eukprot:CAMPEP_0167753008 /NCGR_PEP_ID=MMETSP0110_2-20121227/7466_1 /TAXON_ID=629695 /ORGANISM="Gymnochlora sp., Strain CCMP2014" /LENGTH=1725 /DNA_ID=CAMNT_0007638709 /DNA_START=398 /DNA_END=5575 /DNA_ORIENTATION=-